MPSRTRERRRIETGLIDMNMYCNEQEPPLTLNSNALKQLDNQKYF